MREAKSVEVIPRLVELGATVCASDPVAMTNAQKMRPKLLNLERLRTVMRRPVVFDGRNVWEAERMRRRGFEYYSIGRAPVRRS